MCLPDYVQAGDTSPSKAGGRLFWFRTAASSMLAAFLQPSKAAIKQHSRSV